MRSRGCLAGRLVVEGGGGHQQVGMAMVHPGGWIVVQPQQYGGADDPQADPSQGASLDQAANATLTHRAREAGHR